MQILNLINKNGTPATINAGKVIRPPPPAIESTKAAKNAAKHKKDILKINDKVNKQTPPTYENYVNYIIH